MDHVRGHLDGDLSLAALARVAGRSPHHFHRVFKAITGETLTAHVQRARLERAAYLMMTSPQRKLDSIALEVGFSAHSDFTRVFKKHYGVAPSAWDRKTRLDPQSVEDDYEGMVARARAGRPPPEFVVSEQPERTLLYIRTRAPFIGEPVRTNYERLIAALEQLGVDWRGQELLGWSWDNYETTPLDRVHCDLGFTLPEVPAAIPEGFGIQRFAAHRAVAIHCDGPMMDIAIAWDALYGDWLPESAFETGDLPAMKRFVRRPDEVGWDHYDVWCSLTIRPMLP